MLMALSNRSLIVTFGGANQQVDDLHDEHVVDAFVQTEEFEVNDSEQAQYGELSVNAFGDLAPFDRTLDHRGCVLTLEPP